MTITYHPNLIQGSDEWHMQRLGLLTASEMKLIITPKTLKVASDDKAKIHLYEILAQRLNSFVEPQYISDSMLRGQSDEPLARDNYASKYGGVTEVGFVTNDNHGFVIGYSPDWLVGDDGQAECKSRAQKHHTATIVTKEVPPEFMIQVQTGLIVTERKFCDYVSYCGGMHQIHIRVYPDEVMQKAIINAAGDFHDRLEKAHASFLENVVELGGIPTERAIEADDEMVI